MSTTVLIITLIGTTILGFGIGVNLNDRHHINLLEHLAEQYDRSLNVMAKNISKCSEHTVHAMETLNNEHKSFMIMLQTLGDTAKNALENTNIDKANCGNCLHNSKGDKACNTCRNVDFDGKVTDFSNWEAKNNG